MVKFNTLKINIDTTEFSTLLNECEKDTDELSKVLEEYSNKYPFVHVDVSIQVNKDYLRTQLKDWIISKVDGDGWVHYSRNKDKGCSCC